MQETLRKLAEIKALLNKTNLNQMSDTEIEEIANSISYGLSWSVFDDLDAVSHPEDPRPVLEKEVA